MFFLIPKNVFFDPSPSWAPTCPDVSAHPCLALFQLALFQLPCLVSKRPFKLLLLSQPSIVQPGICWPDLDILWPTLAEIIPVSKFSNHWMGQNMSRFFSAGNHKCPSVSINFVVVCKLTLERKVRKNLPLLPPNTLKSSSVASQTNAQ